MLRQEKGITLIALIVTIIVLLILAAISIAMLTGQNGILGKAAETKKTTSAAQLDEQVKLAIMEARLNGLGKIESTEALDSALKNNVGEGNYTLTETSTGWDIETSKKKYVLDADGKLTTGDNGQGGEEDKKEDVGFYDTNFTLGSPIHTDWLGKRATKYEAKEEVTLWRVYYVDEKYTYLAAQSPIGDFNLFEESSKYPEGFEVSLVGQKLNYRVSSILNSSKDSKAVLATAWLTDVSATSPWNKYKNEDAVFAIGSPTIELFLASYKEVCGFTLTSEISDLGYEPFDGIVHLVHATKYLMYGYNNERYWFASPR